MLIFPKVVKHFLRDIFLPVCKVYPNGLLYIGHIINGNFQREYKDEMINLNVNGKENFFLMTKIEEKEI